MTALTLSPLRRAWLLRAFRWTGIFPLGAFVVVHAAINSRALAGDEAFLAVSGALSRLPLRTAIEIVLVYVPLFVHAAIGLAVTVGRVELSSVSPYPLNLRRALRVTGVVALGFLGLHLWDLPLHTPGAHPSAASLLSMLQAQLSSMEYGIPLRALAYLLGSACVCFHLAAGSWGLFAATSRGTTVPAQRRAAWWCTAFGALLFLLFVDVVVYHATGARLFGGHATPSAIPSVPCPAPPSSGTP